MKSSLRYDMMLLDEYDAFRGGKKGEYAKRALGIIVRSKSG
jgi:hypothetical protein